MGEQRGVLREGHPVNISDQDWEELKLQYIVGGVDVTSLALEYGISESAIRRYLGLKRDKPSEGEIVRRSQEQHIRDKAHEILSVAAEAGEEDGNIALQLAASMGRTMRSLASAAELQATATHRISKHVERVSRNLEGETDMDEVRKHATDIAGLSRAANETASLPGAVAGQIIKATKKDEGDKEGLGDVLKQVGERRQARIPQ